MLHLGLDALSREIHIWCVDLITDADAHSRVWSLLSQEEIRRACSFRFPHLTATYALAHGCLRILLGRYLQIEASELRFTRGEAGKPSLATAASGLEFNFSHARHVAAYAFTRNVSVGIDVEFVTQLPNIDAIARQFFTPAESAELARVPTSSRVDAFFECWVRKESYVKAIGQGLNIPLNSFRVTFLPGDTPIVQPVTAPLPTLAGPWFLAPFRAAPGYIGAAAWNRSPRAIRVMANTSVSSLISNQWS